MRRVTYKCCLRALQGAILNLLTEHILADVLGRLEAQGKRRKERLKDIVIDDLRNAIREGLRVDEQSR